MALVSTILVGLILFAFTTLVATVDIAGIRPFFRGLDDPASVNNTCTVGSYAFDMDNSSLGVYCNTDDVSNFAYDWTFIDINLCIGNNDGMLTSSPEGNFSDSCQDCNITWSHIFLTPVTTTFTTTPHAWTTNTVTSVSTPRWDDLYLGCGACTDRDWKSNPATIDLNMVMFNERGTIGCHTFRGTTMHVKPEIPPHTTTITTTAASTTM